jgi:hypothetical protein
MTAIGIGIGIPFGGRSVVAEFSLTDLDGLVLWLRGDLGVEVSAGVPAEDTDPVLNWLDQSGDGNDFSAAVEADRPPFNASNDDYAGHPTIDPAGNDRMLSNRAAAFWNFLHDGTGCTIVAVWRTTTGGRLLDNIRAATTLRGLDLISAVTPTASSYLSANGAGIVWLSQPTEPDAPRYGIWRSATTPPGVETQISYRRDGASITAAAYGNAASAVDATNVLALFATSGSEVGNMTGACAEIAIYDRYLTLAEVEQVEAYIVGRYGL